MYSKIMAPIDLAHAERLTKAVDVAADLAKHYGAELVFVAATAPTPGPVAHNPEEFSQKLDTFARSQGENHGITATGHAVLSHDPAVDLDKVLMKARDEIGADLVVMASHVPGVKEYLLPSHGGKMASHAGVSVMIVREAE